MGGLYVTVRFAAHWLVLGYGLAGYFRFLFGGGLEVTVRLDVHWLVLGYGFAGCF